MEKCLLMIQEDSKSPTCQADLMNFSSPEVLPKQMPVGIDSSIIKEFSVNGSDDPFEFHLEKAITMGRTYSFRQTNANNCNAKITGTPDFKNSNSPVFVKKRQRPRFSYWDSSLVEKDASFDLLNDTIKFENSVMINSPLQRRRSLSVDNLTFSLHEKDPAIPFEYIKAEAKKIAELIEKSQFFNSKQEESVEKMLTDEVPTGLQISTSSEEGIGLPEVVIFSTKKDSNPDITNKAEYIKYKQFISSHNNSSQQIATSESKTTNDKADENTLFDEDNSSIDGHKQTKTCVIEEKEKLLKMDHAKLKLLQRDIEEVKSKPLKPIKKKKAKGPEKRGPLKVFAPHNSQILNNTNGECTIFNSYGYIYT
ncbi:uncharacterized protein LOC106673461 isoform X2 [Cimex lectularius]|uniref:Uncharacterized protein n=1 Tax=Cimex lectularius TaxID=79782 RepID=A0A8I6TMR0_CIMLE|nr:uncharacterized protein LOC106673461 isoform X2 [Cimex lectularius]